MFYTFEQNNSGGHFVVNDQVTYTVIIEGKDESEAIARAEDLGIYFNGCADGLDCPCCGDRWHKPWGDNGTQQPSIYGRDPSVHKEICAKPNEPYCYVYYKDKKATYHKS